MARRSTAARSGSGPKAALGPELGTPAKAVKFSVNLSADVAHELKRIAQDECVSESSIIEIALRQIFVRISRDRLAPFLRKHGACLRRR
jgi:hypothetical protein